MGEAAVRERRETSGWRPIERVVEPLTTSTRRKKFIGLGLTFAALVLLVLLGSFEQVLRDLHEIGGRPAGTAALANDLFSGPDVNHFRDVLDTWQDIAEAAFASSKTVLVAYAVTDVVLVFVYTLLVGMLLVMLKHELGPAPPESPSQVDLRPYRRPVDIAIFSLGALAIADLTENVLIGLSPHVDGTEGWAPIHSGLLWGAHWLKVLFAVLVVVPGIVAALAFFVQRPEKRRGIVPALAVARGQLLVLAVLLAALFLSDQAVDALRRWYEDVWDAGFAIVVLAWLAVFVLVSTDALLATAARKRADPKSLWWLAGLAVFVGALALAGWYLFDGWIGLATLAGLLLGLAVLSWLVPGIASPTEGRELGAARGWLPVTLGLSVLLLPVLALVGAAAGPLVLGDLRFFRLAGPTAAFVGIALLLFLARDRLSRLWEFPRWRWAFLLATVALPAYVVARVIHNPWRFSEAFGTVAFLAAFLIALSLVLFALIRRAERVQPLDIVSLVRLRCTPVILLVVVWAAVTSAVDRETTYHDVRELTATDAARAVHPGVTVRTAFARWEGREARVGSARPLLFVAAAGGGIRAAYWTATVLSCVLEGQGQEPACSVEAGRANDRGVGSLFAASGISGGSLGLASYAAHLMGDRESGWPSRRLDDDYSAPVVGWGLFVDLPSALVRRTGGSDRTDILERAFERSWLDGLPDRTKLRVLWGGSVSTEDSALARGLLDSWASQTPESPVPILMLNGTKVQEGCRLNVSVLDSSVEPMGPRTEETVEDCLSLRLFESGTRPGDAERAKWSLGSSDDLLTYFCPEEDVRLSTAVMLSARFPYVLPSGRLTRCEDESVSPANVVDGGYFDTSGASPLVELWGTLAREVAVVNRAGACIVPYFLQIDTGYADPFRRGDLSPSEVLVPPVTARRARDAREHNARQAAALLFSGLPETGVAISDRYAHIYPRAHPGIRAPLGWTLSNAAQEELESQLERNKPEIEKVRGWLADDQPCPPPPGSTP